MPFHDIAPEIDVSRLSSTAFDRPGLALSRVLSLDLPGAGRAVFAPETLSPEQRKTLADKWAVGGDGWYKSVLRIATNPLVLFGAIMSAKYPIPLAKEIFKFAPKLTGLIRNPGFLRMKVIGNFDEIYAGLKAGDSTLPEVFKTLGRDVETFRRGHAERVAQAIFKFEAKSGRTFDKRTETLLAARLDGLDRPKGILRRIQEGPAFDTMAKEVRVAYDSAWDQVLSDVNQRGLLTALQTVKITGKRYTALLNEAKRARVAGRPVDPTTQSLIRQVAGLRRASKQAVLEQLRNVGITTGGIEDVRKVGLYFPRRVSRSLEEFARETAQLVAGPIKESQFGKRMLAEAGAVSTEAALPRHGRMLVSPDSLEPIKDLLKNPGLLARNKELIDSGRVLPYGLGFLDVTASYFHSMAKAYGWTVRGHGRAIVQAAESLELSKLPHNKVRAAMLRDSYIPTALGRQTYRQMLSAAQWNSMRLDLVGKFKGSGLRKFLGNDISDWLEKRLVEDRGILSMRNVQGRLASHFYVGALGLNATSSTYNLMQTMLTTIPVIGPKATLQGIERVFGKAGKYFKARGRGVGHEQALASTFKEFGEQGLAGSPLTEEALLTSYRDAWEAGGRLRPNMKGGFDRVKSAMMSLFQGSETIVRLTAFEGTLAKGLAEGLSVQEAGVIAKRVTEATQFVAGTAGSEPALLRNVGPLLKQFGRFPLAYLNFLIGPATEIGSAAQRGGLFGLMPDRNFGTLGRALLSGGLAYEGAKEFLGQDISRGLMFGALPAPMEGQPFSPIPFVPPILSIAGAVVMDATQGELTHIKRALPLFVPGGVALRRFSPALGSKRVGQLTGRDFADYSNRLPDGRIAVFNQSGNLKGYMTPLQLFMKSIGFPPGGSVAEQRERELESYLIAQGARIKDIRKQYLEALYLENDSRKAANINAQYQRLYPGLGGIQVTTQQVRALETRTMVARLERALDRLPADVKPLFNQMVAAVLMQEGENLLGVDPSLLTRTRTSGERDIYRHQRSASVLEEIITRQRGQHALLPPPRPRPRGGGQAAIRPGPRPSGIGVGGSGGDPFSTFGQRDSTRLGAIGF